MTINLQYDSEKKQFHLSNGKISYIFEIINDQFLAHCYWGKAINHFIGVNHVPNQKKTFASYLDFKEPTDSLEFMKSEFPQNYLGDYQPSAISLETANGEDITRFLYEDYQIIEGAPELTELPHARNNEKFPAKTLMIRLTDSVAKLEVQLFYTLFENSSIIIRSAKIINLSPDTIQIKHLASATVDFYNDHYQLISLYGSHQQEFQLQTQLLHHGQIKLASNRGASGPQYVPFMALSQNYNEHSGDVYALSLIYSGNHREIADLDQYHKLRLQIGLNEEAFSWTLNQSEAFQTPQAILAYGASGMNSLSNELYQFTQNHIMPPQFRKSVAPILINSWEMTYFDINEDKILSLIKTASQLGFEAVVLDDGWFLGRNSSKSSLGDWQVDPHKFPNGLDKIAEICHQNDLKFGLWFEPEMISPNSQLMKQHPEWVMKSKYYSPLYGRNQFILDLTKTSVQEYIINTIGGAIENYQIDYIKWDMNRHITDPFSQSPLPTGAKSYSHLYMLSLYKIIGILTERYPKVLFENCSSGGGRFDFGMLYYFPQTWASDNTDGFERQQIQYGASLMFHPYQMTGHVSITPNHQTQRSTPIETRMAVANSTNMGYELDILSITEEEKLTIRTHLEQYKKDRQLIIESNFYRLGHPENHEDCAWLFESKDRQHYLLHAFSEKFTVNKRHHIIKIPYLNPDVDYKIEELNCIVSGQELIHSGIHIAFPNYDYSSVVLHLNVIN